ncbi:polysaccharide pyruvyl transferase family protein [Ensifer sp. MPMI2T]|nr:polysaccharide pyruvyl transferase family protein [Ensifer sp. MPMI2T]
MLVHGGTFDVANYGDLLFPLLLRKRLAQAPISNVSPAGGAAVWTDCVPSVRFEDLLAKPLQGLIIGGGNIIHTMPSKLREYEDAGVGLSGYGDLWICSTLSVDPSVPVIWNAPGVANRFETAFIDLVRRALQRTDYLSVRDAASRDCLLEIDPHLEVAVVPDTAWALPQLWEKAELDARFTSLLNRLGSDAAEPIITIHVNSRYMNDVPIEEVAATIDHLAATTHAKPLLIAIGPCHGDDIAAKRVAQFTSSRPLVLDKPESLEEIVAAISRSIFYIGSSMHGYITAASFGIPAIAVARGKLKFDGLTELTNAPETLISSWADAAPAFAAIDKEVLANKFHDVSKRARKQLDDHWTRINRLLATKEVAGHADPAAFYRARAELLAAMTNHYRTLNDEDQELLRRAEQRLTGAMAKPAKVKAPALLSKGVAPVPKGTGALSRLWTRMSKIAPFS